MSAIKILAFAGSTRTGSFNKKLNKIAAEGARGAGAEVTVAEEATWAFLTAWASACSPSQVNEPLPSRQSLPEAYFCMAV